MEVTLLSELRHTALHHVMEAAGLSLPSERAQAGAALSVAPSAKGNALPVTIPVTEHPPALVTGPFSHKEIDVDRIALPMAVGPILSLAHQSHFLRQLYKDNHAGCAEVKAHACSSGEPCFESKIMYSNSRGSTCWQR